MNKIFGLVGERLSHSFSPEIHSKIYELACINGNYNLFEVKKEKLQSVIESLNVLGVKGTNVTIPYKVDIMKYLDDVSREAKQIGAVNTINIVEG